MTPETAILSDKQIAADLRVPDAATLEQIREELANAIRAGIADAVRVHSHDEVVRRSATWITQ